VLKLSGTETALVLVFAVAAAVLGYALSEADRRKLGRTPWGLPSLIWALFWFLSWLIGLILYLFAHRAEVRRAAQGPAGSIDAYGRIVPTPSTPPLPSAASDFPAYPRRADGGVRDQAAVPAAPPTPPPAPPPVTVAAPPSWQADPSGRFHYRWWTGSEWTSYVATHGQVVVDSSPDQRIGPYGPS
jgi:hypothetical protein